MDMSIVLPVYGNEDELEELHRRLCDVLEIHGLSFEIIAVNDASLDNSLAVLKSLQEVDSRIIIINQEQNSGQHRAVLCGLIRACGEWIVVMDADLQDPPEAIPDLLAKAKGGYAAVFAGKSGQYESPSRLFTSRIFKKALHLISSVPQDAGMFMIINRTMQERLLTMGGPAPSIVAMIGCSGLPMASIPIERAKRPGSLSAYTPWMRFKSACQAFIWVISWKLRRKFPFLDNDHEKKERG